MRSHRNGSAVAVAQPSGEPLLDGAVRVRRILKTPLVDALGWTCVRDTEALRKPRTHGSWALTVLHHGTTWVETSSWSGLIDPSVLVLHPPGESYRTSHPLGCGDRGVNLLLDDRLMEGLAPAAAGRRPRPVLIAAPRPAALLAARLLPARAVSGDLDPLEIEQTAADLVSAALRGSREAPGMGHGREGRAARRRRGTDLLHREIAERAKAWLALHHSEPVSLGDVARASHASPSHLNRVFRRATGSSLYQYILRRRLVAALDRLLEGQEPLASIALETGFASHSHLTASFHRVFGIAPRVVRRLRSSPSLRDLRAGVSQGETGRGPVFGSLPSR